MWHNGAMPKSESNPEPTPVPEPQPEPQPDNPEAAMNDAARAEMDRRANA